MNAKLYIRNFSHATTENDLQTLFASSGTVVSVDIITDRVTGRSRGYGFIQMSNPVEAENAVERFDGWSLDNCELRVGRTQYRERRSSLRDRGTTDLSRLSPRRDYLPSS